MNPKSVRPRSRPLLKSLALGITGVVLFPYARANAQEWPRPPAHSEAVTLDCVDSESTSEASAAKISFDLPPLGTEGAHAELRRSAPGVRKPLRLTCERIPDSLDDRTTLFDIASCSARAPNVQLTLQWGGFTQAYGASLTRVGEAAWGDELGVDAGASSFFFCKPRDAMLVTSI